MGTTTRDGRRPGVSPEERAEVRREARRRLDLLRGDHVRRIKNLEPQIKKLERELRPLQRRFDTLERAASLGHEGAQRQRGDVGTEVGDLTSKLANYRSMVRASGQAIAAADVEAKRIGSDVQEAELHADADAELAVMAEERAERNRKRKAQRRPHDVVMDRLRRLGLVPKESADAEPKTKKAAETPTK